ncbi:VOC family protein [Agrococcus baldri]|uniref:Glyoxalase n=1 Tax=Agrococcus baldri TaxID=153730 RepID=A0AA87UQU8_9MICO|nr:VOC family protein [Agrococcus baldri]GEK78854.1 glyoxalase [Agrococcus baldri]
MAVRSGFPILSTRDLARLEAFYVEAFGAERSYAFDDAGRDVYVALSVGGARLGIGQDDALDGSPNGTAIWLYVDDVDTAFRQAIDAGATSVAEPADMPWGERVAQLRDPDGFVLHLGAPA